MKKVIILAIAAIVAVFAVSSCNKTEGKKNTGTASYQYGMSQLSGNPMTALDIFAIFKEELTKALPGAQLESGTFTVQNANFESTDAAVSNACKNAEIRVNDEVEIDLGNSFTLEVMASHEGAGMPFILYSHKFAN